MSKKKQITLDQIRQEYEEKQLNLYGVELLHKIIKIKKQNAERQKRWRKRHKEKTK